MIAVPDRMLGQALAYARCGWPVFPCIPGAKEPATRHGFHDASTHPDQIRRWWNRSPDANVAIATGSPGPDVLDVDQHGPAGNGFPAYRRLKAAGLLDGARAIIATPGGGLHLYFAGSGQASGRLRRHHLDLRSAGGCVLATIPRRRHTIPAAQAHRRGIRTAERARRPGSRRGQDRPSAPRDCPDDRISPAIRPAVKVIAAV